MFEGIKHEHARRPEGRRFRWRRRWLLTAHDGSHGAAVDPYRAAVDRYRAAVDPYRAAVDRYRAAERDSVP
jgi:hypothetical protein